MIICRLSVPDIPIMLNRVHLALAAGPRATGWQLENRPWLGQSYFIYSRSVAVSVCSRTHAWRHGYDVIRRRSRCQDLRRVKTNWIIAKTARSGTKLTHDARKRKTIFRNIDPSIYNTGSNPWLVSAAYWWCDAARTTAAVAAAVVVSAGMTLNGWSNRVIGVKAPQ